jgi:hypothetical protein
MTESETKGAQPDAWQIIDSDTGKVLGTRTLEKNARGDARGFPNAMIVPLYVAPFAALGAEPVSARPASEPTDEQIADKLILSGIIDCINDTDGMASVHREAERAVAFVRAALRPSFPVQAEAPPVAWLAFDRAKQLFVINGDGPHDIFGGFPVYANQPKITGGWTSGTVQGSK